MSDEAMREFRERVWRPGQAKIIAEALERWLNTIPELLEDSDSMPVSFWRSTNAKNKTELHMRVKICAGKRKRGRKPKHAPSIVVEIDGLRIGDRVSVRKAAQAKGKGARDFYNRERRKSVVRKAS